MAKRICFNGFISKHRFNKVSFGTSCLTPVVKVHDSLFVTVKKIKDSQTANDKWTIDTDETKVEVSIDEKSFCKKKYNFHSNDLFVRSLRVPEPTIHDVLTDHFDLTEIEVVTHPHTSENIEGKFFKGTAVVAES